MLRRGGGNISAQLMARPQGSSNGGGHYHIPMVLLYPAHIQLYGVDATLNTLSQPPITEAATNSLPLTPAETLPAAQVETPPPTPAEEQSRVSNNADVSLENHDAFARSPDLEQPVTGNVRKQQPQRQQRQQQRHQQKRQQRRGFPAGSGAKREKLPSAPPAMSGRCQIHPALMPDLGVFPGDPVLVLALADGWLSDPTPSPLPLPVSTGSGGGGRGATATAASPEPRHTVDNPGRDVTARGLGDDDEGGGAGGATAAVPSQRWHTSIEPNGEEAGVAFRDRDDGDDGSGGGGAVVDIRSYILGSSVSEAPEDQAQRKDQPPSQALQDQGIAVLSASAELRCFLCTVWNNPHLSSTQAAVDGRVNVPLADSDYPPGPIRSPSDVTAAGGPTGRSDDPGKEKVSTTKREPIHGSADSITSCFMTAAVCRHQASLAALVPASRERMDSGGAVVGIIPLHSANGGLPTVASVRGAGGVAAGLCGAPPLASRVSARVLRPAARIPRKASGVKGSAAFGGSAGKRGPAAAARPVRASDTDRRLASTTSIDQEIPRKRENPSTISANILDIEKYNEGGGEGGGGDGPVGTENRRTHPLRYFPFPPEYTSLVKRSLRHLVVSCGCDVAVPACPDLSVDAAAGMGGPGDVSGSGGVEGGASRRRPADGTALVRIGSFSTVGGGGSSEVSHFDGVALNGVGASGIGANRSTGSGSGTGAASRTGALLAPFGSPFSPSRSAMAGSRDLPREGALTALLRGMVCVIGQDSIVLVEGEDGAGAADAVGVSAPRADCTPGKKTGVGDSGDVGNDGGGAMRADAGQKGKGGRAGVGN